MKNKSFKEYESVLENTEYEININDEGEVIVDTSYLDMEIKENNLMIDVSLNCDKNEINLSVEYDISNLDDDGDIVTDEKETSFTKKIDITKENVIKICRDTEKLITTLSEKLENTEKFEDIKSIVEKELNEYTF
jgi:hypothetical protein